MSKKSISLTDDLHTYLIKTSLRETEVQKSLRSQTAKLSESNMQISPEQGQFMQLLVKLTGASQIIEVGVFTGYSTLAMALGLEGRGKIVACDISKKWTDIATRYWDEAGVSSLIELKLGPAIETLRALRNSWQCGHFDLAFIDADKENYIAYYEQCLELIRPGGLILIDNTLWDGKVADISNNEEETTAIRQLNNNIYQDERVDISLLPISDGLTLARKR